jgi:hypothetical protein
MAPYASNGVSAETQLCILDYFYMILVTEVKHLLQSYD